LFFRGFKRTFRFCQSSLLRFNHAWCFCQSLLALVFAATTFTLYSFLPFFLRSLPLPLPLPQALEDVPEEHFNRIARFLETRGHQVSSMVHQCSLVTRPFRVVYGTTTLTLFLPYFGYLTFQELAMQVSTDPEHRFELAMQIGDLSTARSLLDAADDGDARWKQVGDAALAADTLDLTLAEECYSKADDFGGLLLLHTTLGDAAGVASLAEKATKAGALNVAFICYLLLRKPEDCVKLLCDRYVAD
jgi:hypothetical protein